MGYCKINAFYALKVLEGLEISKNNVDVKMATMMMALVKIVSLVKYRVVGYAII